MLVADVGNHDRLSANCGLDLQFTAWIALAVGRWLETSGGTISTGDVEDCPADDPLQQVQRVSGANEALKLTAEQGDRPNTIRCLLQLGYTSGDTFLG